VFDVSQDATLDALVFERREEAVRDGVVPAVALSTHASHKAKAIECGDVVGRAVGTHDIDLAYPKRASGIFATRWRVPASKSDVRCGKTRHVAANVKNGSDVKALRARPAGDHIPHVPIDVKLI
jgi:hypothetical protein